MPRPIVILPGYFAGAETYQALAQDLRERGFTPTIVPLQRRDWWPTLGGRPVNPILDQIDRTVMRVLEQSGSDKVHLIGHSAGGWIARIYLGDQPYSPAARTWKARPHVATLLTLGTPHLSQERWTRPNLEFVNTTYPGAFYPDIAYVCVAGKSVFGRRRWGTWLAYNSYELTCGQGATWGDGITPIAAAHLDGAENLTLDNVQHSPRRNRLWYGSPEVVAQWCSYLD